MSTRLTWGPNTEQDIASYSWQRAPDSGGVPGTWTDLVAITHDLGGPNYDVISGRFFYVDATSDNTNWYRIRSVDAGGNVSAYSPPFQPASGSQPPPFPNTVGLSEDYNAENEFQYVDDDGVPIKDAQIRIYKKVDYDLKNLSATIGTTITNEVGGWVSPIIVEAGFTYTIEFLKPGAFGPDPTEVVVP